MKERFKITPIDNVLQSLNDDDALKVISLSLATNDLTLNLEAINKFPVQESLYFFVISLSILRELAKSLRNIDSGSLHEHMSQNTKKLLQEVSSKLVPYEKGTLTKDVLKPLRDTTFHYDHVAARDAKPLIENALAQLKADDVLEVGFSEDDKSPLGQRYIFADKFRSLISDQLLASDLISTISKLSADIVSLLDSLLADLHRAR